MRAKVNYNATYNVGRRYIFLAPHAHTNTRPSSLRNYGKWREELHPQLDYRQIIAEGDLHRRNVALRQCEGVSLDAIQALYEKHRSLQGELNRLRAERRQASRLYNTAATADGEGGRGKFDAAHLESVEEEANRVGGELKMASLALPNLSHPSVPLENRVIEVFGPTPPIHLATPDTTPGPLAAQNFRKENDHVKIGRELDIIDWEAGSRVAGSGFYFLKGQGALLEQALIQYALSVAIKAGFQPIIPPDVVNSKFIHGCGFFPRQSEAYGGRLPVFTAEIDGEQEGAGPLRVLAATGEIPMAGYYAGQTLDGKQLPMKWVGISHCFRPEIGHHGALSRGLYRVHQFTKVELFVIKDGDGASSDACLQEILALQKNIFANLGLRCRLLHMAHEELGNGARQKYDIEAHFPSMLIATTTDKISAEDTNVDGGWGEISSASNCSDYQARRLGIRVRESFGKPLSFVHTLNGTACAVPRIIQAILENFNYRDEKTGQLVVEIPSILHPFMLDGSTRITQ